MFQTLEAKKETLPLDLAFCAQLWNVANMARVECPTKVAFLSPFHQEVAAKTVKSVTPPEDFFGKGMRRLSRT